MMVFGITGELGTIISDVRTKLIIEHENSIVAKTWGGGKCV